MAKILNIEKINENDSAEMRVSKLNSNFQSLMNAALTLDRTGLLTRKTAKQSSSAVDKLADIVEYDAGRIKTIEDSIAGIDVKSIVRITEYVYSENGWSYRKWSDGFVQLWGRATGTCQPGKETVISNQLPFELGTILNWQSTLRKTSVNDISLERSYVENGVFSAVIKNGSSSVAIAVANAYIIGLDEKNGD